MRDRKLVAVAVFAMLLICLPGIAQDQPKKLQKGSTLDGAAGLFKTIDAESLRQGEFNFSLGYDYLNRDPGELNFRTLPVAFGIGLFDRVELFGAVDAYKRVGASSTRVYRLIPGQLPRLASSLTGAPSAMNDAPFMDVPKAKGMGDVRFGVKINALSERRGNPFGLS
ncbi:MAG: hypothetical protein FJW35_14355, partial [Acidobacteria bacterium]|nr:hypothetical protein [Acidobacteriota bacterium]